MSDQAKPVARPWRSFLRFRVRGMIVVVLVIGGWLGWIVRSARIQREAVAAITEARGLVTYDWDERNGTSVAPYKPWAPGWLVSLVGVDYFGHVATVVLEANDTAFTQVRHLNQLQSLSVGSHSDLSDEWLVHLDGLTSLTYLDISVNPVTDRGLSHLEGLSNLSILLLGNTRITDAGLAHLKGLGKLSQLDLGHTKVSDAGLVHLKGLTNLYCLELRGTEVTDAGLAHLKGLAKLSDLDLSGTEVTGAGVKELQQALPALKIDR